MICLVLLIDFVFALVCFSLVHLLHFFPISHVHNTTILKKKKNTQKQLIAASTGAKAKALFDFVPSEDGELGFKVNDVLVIHKQEGEWWEGELNGKRGVLPSNYVQLL
jgi:hypothetical protein